MTTMIGTESILKISFMGCLLSLYRHYKHSDYIPQGYGRSFEL